MFLGEEESQKNSIEAPFSVERKSKETHSAQEPHPFYNSEPSTQPPPQRATQAMKHRPHKGQQTRLP